MASSDKSSSGILNKDAYACYIDNSVHSEKCPPSVQHTHKEKIQG